MDWGEFGGRVPIAAGAGRVAHLAADVNALAGKRSDVLLVADAGLKPFGIVDRVAAYLDDAGHHVVVYDQIAGEPKEHQVEAALALGRGDWVHCVVALGGGSALDVAKMVALLMREEGARLTDYRLAAKPLPTGGVHAICIPTTAGTGSEVTQTSILSGPDGTKYWYWGEPLFASLAILDPELTVNLPPRFTAMTGMDALVHAIEAATNRHAKPASDAVAHRAIHLVATHLRAAVADGTNLSARAGMLEAAALGGVAISQAGTALAHNIGHAVGSLAPVPHGLAVTLAFAATAEWVVEGNRTGFARVAEAMQLGDDPDAVPDAFRRLATDIGLDLDTSAAAPGVNADALAAHMAAPENASMRKSTKRVVADADLLPLAQMTLGLGRNSGAGILFPEGEGGRGAAG